MNSFSLTYPSARPQVAAQACAHCGLDVPAALTDPGATEQFCCSGCRTVYQVIHACGLENYYRIRARDQAVGRAARTTGRRYDEFDDELFERLHVLVRPDGLKQIELFLEGVHCSACVWLVEKLPRLVAHVREARLDVRRGLVSLIWDPAAGGLAAAARVLDSLGYPPHPARDAAVRELRRREDQRFLIHVAVAGAAAGNAMLLGFALYSGAGGGLDGPFGPVFRWLSMLIGVIALAWPGRIFFRGAWAALRTRTAHLDLPIALGLAAGGIAGTFNTLTGRGEIYFDSLTVLIFALLVGRWIQRRQQRWAADAIELLHALTPTAARRVEFEPGGGAQVREVPIEALRIADLVEVRAGETLPVDGRIESGESTVNEALLTGEARRRAVGPGMLVFAGTLNDQATLRIRAESTGAQTRIGRLMALIEEAARQPAPVVRLADSIAGVFTIAMLSLAALTLALWLHWSPGEAVDHAIALLIVTCPCALGLATPLVLTMAIARAARARILVKGGAVLEQLARPGLIFLDKTGTLTQGRLAVLAWHALTAPDEDRQIRAIVRAVEGESAHPVARALVAYLNEPTTAVATEVRQTATGGIAALVARRKVLIGTRAWLAAQGVNTEKATALVEAAAERGHTPVLVAVDRQMAAVIELGDPVHPDAPAAIEALRRMGWRIRILSGDEQRAVEVAARAAGIEPEAAFGGVTPEGKVAAVRDAQRHGPVLMVGDGVNDAAALTAATVGVAVQGGAEASLAAADVYLDRPGLAWIVALVTAGRKTVKLIRTAMGVSLAYNSTMAVLAMSGQMTPLLAAVLMPISSMAMLAIAVMGRTFEATTTGPSLEPQPRTAAAKTGRVPAGG